MEQKPLTNSLGICEGSCEENKRYFWYLLVTDTPIRSWQESGIWFVDSIPSVENIAEKIDYFAMQRDYSIYMIGEVFVRHRHFGLIQTIVTYS